MGAFHAYDIRGIYGVDFDKDTAYKVGYFIPELLQTAKVLVGRDCRVSSEEIHDALIQGLNDAGADVYDLGLASTPMVYFGTANYGFQASVQITASHNPAEYNGMKVSRENALPVGFDSGLGQIKEWIDAGRPTPVADVRGKVYQLDIKADYLKFMEKYLGDYSDLKVAFDLSNGMACLFAHEVFGERHSYIYDTLDGSFPNHEPNPLIPKNVVPLKNLVRDTDADLGVIYDGDADRVMFVDNLARFVAPDLIIALLSKYFIGERGERNPRVLQEIRTSKAVAEYLTPMGCEVHTWRVGRAFAAPKLRASGAASWPATTISRISSIPTAACWPQSWSCASSPPSSAKARPSRRPSTGSSPTRTRARSTSASRTRRARWRPSAPCSRPKRPRPPAWTSTATASNSRTGGSTSVLPTPNLTSASYAKPPKTNSWRKKWPKYVYC